ncbi:MAG: hypothetical protein JWN34_4492 [Bryobacterales bacterium]|nr:hypothetical protein [Bryobacterales bacterium]
MPTDEKDPPDAIHFKSLVLENVRAFGSLQSLELADDWNLILGKNGVGKTTLLQLLAVMRPVPAYKSPGDKEPTLFTPQLSEHEKDEDIAQFIRRGGPGKATITATLKTEAGADVEVGVEIVGGKILKEVNWRNHPLVSKGGGPLVIGYGAARHIGRDNLEEIDKRDPTESLFGQLIDLYDAEEILMRLDHAVSKSGPGSRDFQQLESLKTVVAALLPGDTKADDIDVRLPRIPGRAAEECGVHVKTPSGFVSLAELSIGYQTMFALTVDLAWRLFNAFPKSTKPLHESAIVLIDEVDLHMHPEWQRDLREHMLDHFPRVQFIATTHSPITAQETLSEGGAVAVVRWLNDEAQLVNNPIPAREWRFDQLLTSKLFELGSDRSQQAEEKFDERLALMQMPSRTPEQNARLRELNKFVASLPTARSPSAQRFDDLISEFIEKFPEGVTR